MEGLVQIEICVVEGTIDGLQPDVWQLRVTQFEISHKVRAGEQWCVLLILRECVYTCDGVTMWDEAMLNSSQTKL